MTKWEQQQTVLESTTLEAGALRLSLSEGYAENTISCYAALHVSETVPGPLEQAMTTWPATIRNMLIDITDRLKQAIAEMEGEH